MIHIKRLLRKNEKYMRFGLTSYQFVETGTINRKNIGRDQLLKCVGFSLYPFYLNCKRTLKGYFIKE